eukprot:scaffold1784_cov116-Cylindrotheca_fusiformis.AAC.8
MHGRLEAQPPEQGKDLDLFTHHRIVDIEVHHVVTETMKRLSNAFLLTIIHLVLHCGAGFVTDLRQLASNSHEAEYCLWPCSTSLLAQSPTSFSETKGTKTVVRDILNLLESRYGSEGDWKRTKMYIYRTRAVTVASVTQVLDFLDSLVSEEVVVSLLKQNPRILSKSVQSYLRPTAEFLMELWGPELFQQAMLRKPQLLLTSGVGYNEHDTTSLQGEQKQSVEQILIDMTGISANALEQLKRSDPFVFGLRSEKVEEVLKYVNTILKPADKGETILRKLVIGYPSMLNLSVDANLRPRVEFLRNTLQFTDKELAKIVQAGAIMGLSVDENLKPTLKYLQNELSLGDDLKKSVLSHPQLLALSLQNIQKKAEFFKSIGPSLALRIARRCPAIFSLNLDTNIIPTLKFLARIWGCRWDDPAMEAWLSEYPNILTLSIEGNLQPTMNFFNRTGYTTLDSGWNLVEGSKRIRGRYIASSLFHRLLPRWHYCVNHELPPPPLHLIVSASDVAFCHQLSVEVDGFLTFREEAIPRLKFSSQFDTWLKTGRRIDIQ